MCSLKGGYAASKSNEMLVDVISSETEMRELEVWDTASMATRIKFIEHEMLRFSLYGHNRYTCTLKTSTTVIAIGSASYCFLLSCTY